jgi:large subunit ribosomal protein L5
MTKHEKLLSIKYKEQIVPKMQETFNYDNVNMIPRITKVVLNRGLGEATSNSKVVEHTFEQFKKITGQKPLVTKAKKSVSNFKLREGMAIGCKVTLRRRKMYDFLSKFININLPKIRDFRGVSPKAFDGAGNYNLGINVDNIFPELGDSDQYRGMNITIVTTAKTDKEAFELLKQFGMPFRETANAMA